MSSDSPSFHGYIDVRSLTLDWSKRQEETKFFARNCDRRADNIATSSCNVRSNVERKGLFFLLPFFKYDVGQRLLASERR